jgi:exodeoxyribonuclease VII small subunit
MAKKKSDLESMVFEDAMRELEELVEAMEDGEIPLNDLIDKYERGAGLLKVCQKRLTDAELRIEMIRKKNDGTVVTTDASDLLGQDLLEEES